MWYHENSPIVVTTAHASREIIELEQRAQNDSSSTCKYTV
jgi:hypothetical protein